jgi:hypothetical protein
MEAVQADLEPNIIAHGLVHHLVDAMVTSPPVLRRKASSLAVETAACSVTGLRQARLNVHIRDLAIEEHSPQYPLAVLRSTA